MKEIRNSKYYVIWTT